MQIGLVNVTAIQYETATVSLCAVNTDKCLVVKSVYRRQHTHFGTLYSVYVLGALQLTCLNTNHILKKQQSASNFK